MDNLNNHQEQIRAKMAAAEAADRDARCMDGGMPTDQGAARCLGQLPARPNFKDRLQAAISRHRRDGRRDDMRQELVFLLDKNPEIARILDLIDALGE
jgi:hypothetical protein